MAKADEAKIQLKVRAAIDDHGTDIDVLKYDDTTPLDQYRQGTPAFDSPVSVRGRGIRRPTSDQISFIGDGEEVEIAFLFSRLELNEKFPSATEPYWVTNDDQIGFEGKRYRILESHPTGKVAETYSMLVVIAETAPGEAETTYP
jgi:hypothetical protein